MKHFTRFFLLPLIMFIALPEQTNAHLIGGNGLASGIAHPLHGIDHLLAMVAVGIISTRMGGKTIWKVPSTFVAFMLVGSLLAIGGIGMPIAETGIALSVLFLGVFIALSKNMPISWVMTCVALFAIFHGHAHGEELTSIANPALYSIGFVFSTTFLHITGILIGHWAKKTRLATGILRYAGACMGVMGILFLF
jgi:urease accessory protein